MKAVITVVGKDMVGILAGIADVCRETNINIEEVTQSVLRNLFAMIMLVDISECNIAGDELLCRFKDVGQKMCVEIILTRQELFDAMHRI